MTRDSLLSESLPASAEVDIMFCAFFSEAGIGTVCYYGLGGKGGGSLGNVKEEFGLKKFLTLNAMMWW